MNSRSKYKTKQREILISYFETVPGVHVTAGDVCDYLKAHEAPIRCPRRCEDGHRRKYPRKSMVKQIGDTKSTS